MESLRERAAPSSEVEADAIGLVRSESRYEPPPGRKQRVRARLLEHRVGTRGRARPIFGFAVVAVLVLAVGTSVALGRRGIARSYRSWVTPATTDAPSVPSPPSVLPSVPQPAPAPAVSESPDEVTAPRASPRASLPASGGHGRSAAEDERLVFEAMRALRQEADAERAARSLDEYLRRHPDGELAEEALALSIEAATMRSDARAKELASRYLAKYPNGRFRSAAERARARFTP